MPKLMWREPVLTTTIISSHQGRAAEQEHPDNALGAPRASSEVVRADPPDHRVLTVNDIAGARAAA